MILIYSIRTTQLKAELATMGSNILTKCFYHDKIFQKYFKSFEKVTVDLCS